jgi:cysteine synthase
MSIKSLLMKSTLRMKGMSKEQAEAIAEKMEANPELMQAMQAIEANPELKALMETIQKEIEEKTKGGMDQMMASAGVMMKHKNELAKYRDLLAPLMTLMQK